MSNKKSFSIPKGLATGIRTSIQSATTNHGQLHYDMMSIDSIERDPQNPRKLLITREEMLNGLSKADLHYDQKMKELEALNELAESIKKVGIRNAIEVYKDDHKYRIISGERRYLAAILAGQTYVPTRINQKLDELKLRYIQWVENINRQDLSLWEKYNNLVSMADAFYKANHEKIDADTMQSMLGVSNTQSYRYVCLLNADHDIIDLVKSGKLTNLKLVQELVCIKNKAERQAILAKIQHATESATSLSQFKQLREKKSASKQAISLGKVNHPRTVQYLIQAILRDTKFHKYQAKFNALDLSSAKAVNKAFKELMKAVEHELSVKETANEI